VCKIENKRLNECVNANVQEKQRNCFIAAERERERERVRVRVVCACACVFEREKERLKGKIERILKQINARDDKIECM